MIMVETNTNLASVVGQLDQLIDDTATKTGQLLELLKGASAVLATDKQYLGDEDAEEMGDDEMAEFIYELPIVRWETKHGYLQHYAVLELKPDGLMVCGGLYEDYPEKKEVKIDALDVYSLLALGKAVTEKAQQ